jgi:geranylgeranyl diphosphate synthase type II
MLVAAYEYLNKLNKDCLQKVLRLFNKTARQVCEGQQLDMDFAQRASSGEKNGTISFDEYVNMISLKTSVLLAASLQLGAMLGGAGLGNQEHLYEFGRNLGIAFQIQDDYLDAFGDPGKFGKQVGGDIMANKKTFLMIKAFEVADKEQRKALQQLMRTDDADKIEKVTNIFLKCGVDKWAMALKDQYANYAFQHLDEIAVLSVRKEPLRQLALNLMQREH